MARESGSTGSPRGLPVSDEEEDESALLRDSRVSNPFGTALEELGGGLLLLGLSEDSQYALRAALVSRAAARKISSVLLLGIAGGGASAAGRELSTLPPL
jgi:hypothetical protein